MINAWESILQCWKRGMKSESGFSLAMTSQPFWIIRQTSSLHLIGTIGNFSKILISFPASYSIAKWPVSSNEQRCKLTYLPVIANLPIWTLTRHLWYDYRGWNRASQTTTWFPLKTKSRIYSYFGTKSHYIPILHWPL